MNKDQVKGRVKKAAGGAKVVAGKVLHSPALTAKGRLQQAAGSVQATYGDLKSVARREAAKTRRTTKKKGAVVAKKVKKQARKVSRKVP